MNVKEYLDSIGSKYSRVFILYSSTAVTAPVFKCKSLATTGGRMDVVARTLTYAICDVRPCRQDTLFIAHLEGPPRPPRQLFFDGDLLEEPLSEGRVCRLLLSGLSEDKGGSLGFAELVGILMGKASVFTMHERGLDIGDVEWRAVAKKPLAFILGDHRGFPPYIEGFLLRRTQSISIGPTPYLASHVAAYVNEFIDRARLAWA